MGMPNNLPSNACDLLPSFLQREVMGSDQSQFGADAWSLSVDTQNLGRKQDSYVGGVNKVPGFWNGFTSVLSSPSITRETSPFSASVQSSPLMPPNRPKYLKNRGFDAMKLSCFDCESGQLAPLSSCVSPPVLSPVRDGNRSICSVDGISCGLSCLSVSPDIQEKKNPEDEVQLKSRKSQADVGRSRNQGGRSRDGAKPQKDKSKRQKSRRGKRSKHRAHTEGSQDKKVALYKTELCRSFEETGTCRFGTKCLFAHSQEELRKVDRHPRYKTEICESFWRDGHCKYGRRCCFLHISEGGTSSDDQPLPQRARSRIETIGLKLEH